MNSHLKTLKVGMLGCGVVGSEVARLLIDSPEDFAARSGAKLELAAVAVRDISIKRPGIDPSLLTTDAESIVNDPKIDIIIEVMGGFLLGPQYKLAIVLALFLGVLMFRPQGLMGKA